jgi:hypothetical protein
MDCEFSTIPWLVTLDTLRGVLDCGSSLITMRIVAGYAIQSFVLFITSALHQSCQLICTVGVRICRIIAVKLKFKAGRKWFSWLIAEWGCDWFSTGMTLSTQLIESLGRQPGGIQYADTFFGFGEPAMVFDMLARIAVTANTRHTQDAVVAVKPIYRITSNPEPRCMTVKASSRDGASVIGGTVVIQSRAVDPLIQFRQIAHMMLIQAITLPVQITLAMISGTQNQINGTAKLIMVASAQDVKFVKITLGRLVHLKPKVLVRCRHSVSRRLKTALDRRIRWQGGCHCVGCLLKRLVLFAMTFRATFGRKKSARFRSDCCPI